LEEYDVIIVGAGVVGALCARELSRYRLRVLLVEKAADVCSGASKANSGIVHATTSPRPGSLKARYCAQGGRLMPAVCRELSVPFERVGSLTVAMSHREMRVLRGLLARGTTNGDEGLEIVEAERLRCLEPALSEAAVAALYAPNVGVVNPMLLTIAAAENAVMNGVTLALNTEVTGLLVEGERIVGVATGCGEYRCRYLVNATGAHSDEVMRWAGLDDLRLRPRRGDYFVLDRPDRRPGPSEPGHSREGDPLVRHVIFPIPTPASKGILITPTTEGNLLLGPTSTVSHWREHPPVDGDGLATVEEQVKRLVHSLDLRRCIAVFAGSRPSGARDFLVRLEQRPAGLLNLAGIESPGLTAAPAIAKEAVRLLAEDGLNLSPNEEFDPVRPAPVRVTELSPEERAGLVAEDPAYGRIICRCEEVSEGEIVDAIHSSVPATTLDALKKRLRVGAGRCQGGFDLPLVVEILARELGVSPYEVTKSGSTSAVLAGPTPAAAGSEE